MEKGNLQHTKSWEIVVLVKRHSLGIQMESSGSTGIHWSEIGRALKRATHLKY
ncbi:hypothetical protein [Maribacter algicola]|uniref:hypothetical protein n=1 Tax=Maribacter algicola TaxID=2498892 RepID=UPI001403EF30|nr:hypothetical protein [Maribacter algicola]